MFFVVRKTELAYIAVTLYTLNGLNMHNLHGIILVQTVFFDLLVYVILPVIYRERCGNCGIVFMLHRGEVKTWAIQQSELLICL